MDLPAGRLHARTRTGRSTSARSSPPRRWAWRDKSYDADLRRHLEERRAGHLRPRRPAAQAALGLAEASVTSPSYFAKHYGVDAKQFVAVANSFSVNTQMKRADELIKSYGVTRHADLRRQRRVPLRLPQRRWRRPGRPSWRNGWPPRPRSASERIHVREDHDQAHRPAPASRHRPGHRLLGAGGCRRQGALTEGEEYVTIAHPAAPLGQRQGRGGGGVLLRLPALRAFRAVRGKAAQVAAQGRAVQAAAGRLQPGLGAVCPRLLRGAGTGRAQAHPPGAVRGKSSTSTTRSTRSTNWPISMPARAWTGQAFLRAANSHANRPGPGARQRAGSATGASTARRPSWSTASTAATTSRATTQLLKLTHWLVQRELTREVRRRPLTPRAALGAATTSRRRLAVAMT